MIHALLKIFGLDPVVSKRPPTARKKAAAVKPKPVQYPERAPDYDRPVVVSWEQKEARRALATVTSVGAALRVYARITGQVGSRPSPQYVAAARAVLGERRWAFFQALTLADKRTPMLSEQDIGDLAKEAGLVYGLDRDVSFRLDVWEGVAALETAAFGKAMRAGQKPADPIVIPEDIQQRLRDLKKMRAHPLLRKGGDGRGKAGGPDAPKADEATPAPVAGDAVVGETAPATPTTEVTPETPVEGVDPTKPEGDEPPAGPGKP